MNLQGANILVTGGCGLIGSTTIDQLLTTQKPAKIVIFDNLARGSMRNVESLLQDQRVELVRGDIRDNNAVLKATEGMDAVVHMAALRITACAADPREAMEVMCDGTFNVIDAAHKMGVKKVLAASSASVLGLADTVPTTEEHHPYNNRTWYGASKVMLEGLLRSYNDMYGLNYVSTRYFNVYGPRMDVHGVYTEVLVRWIERIDAGLPPTIFGDGMQTLDLVFIEDVARPNILAAKSSVTAGVYNVGSGTETSLLELAQTLLRAMESDLEVEHGPERKVNAVQRRAADVEAARREIGFEATVGLEEGLQRLVAWWRSQRVASAQ